MRRSTIPTAGIMLALLYCLPANAGIYTFSYSSLSGPVESGSGVFTTSDTLTGGFYDVLSISGTATGTASGGIGTQTSTIVGLSTYASADNDYFPTDPHFDFGGMSFVTASGLQLNLYSDLGKYLVTDSIYDPVGGTPVANDAVVSLSISAVPEPLTLSIFSIGILGAAAMRRRKKA